MTDIEKHLESFASECSVMERGELVTKCLSLERSLFVSQDVLAERAAENEQLRKQLWIMRADYEQSVKMRVELTKERDRLREAWEQLRAVAASCDTECVCCRNAKRRAEAALKKEEGK